MKYIILTLIFTVSLFGQIQNHHLSVLKKRGTVAGSTYPSIVYTDTVSVDGFSGAGTAGADLTFTHWGSIQANDLILLLLTHEDGIPAPWSSTSDVSEAGYTFMYCNGNNGGVAVGGFYKVAAGTESGTFTVTASTAQEQVGAYIIVRGANTTDPIDSIGAFVLVDPAATGIDVVGVATANNYSLVIGHVMFNGSDWASLAWGGTGWNLFTAVGQRTNNGNTASIQWGYKFQETAGASGTINVTNTTSDIWGGRQFSVNPE